MSRYPIADTIAQQIGHKAFVMMGTGNDKWAEKDALLFTVRGSRKWQKVKVRLTPSDTYQVTFYKIVTRNGFTQVHQQTIEDVYVDMLHEVIQNATGLDLSL